MVRTGKSMISVIIPVYNSEKYLKATIQSVIEQDYRDIEIILVNDGSTDDSLSICKQLQSGDSRIHIINQENSGATNKVDDVDNSAISDSLGTAMTADFLLFLLQNEEMKAKSEIVCKITKNRFNGKTDIWVMGIDYPKMRFFDIEKTNGQTFTSKEQKENYSTYANNEIKEQSKQDMKNLKKQDEIDSFLNDLGIS